MREETAAGSPDPSGFSADALTELLRSGARQLIEQAFEAELRNLKTKLSNERMPGGHERLTRQGHLPGQEATTGIGSSEYPLRSILDHAPIYVEMTDLNGKVLQLNLPNNRERIPSGEGAQDTSAYRRLPSSEEVDQQVIKTRQPIHLEQTISSKKGDQILHSVRFPVIGKSEELLGVGCIALDITTSKALEKKLLLAQHIGKIGHWEINITTEAITWSPETFRIYGLDPDSDQPTFEETFSFYHPDDVEHVLKSFEEAFEAGHFRGVNARLILKDGSIRSVYADGVPLTLDSSGRPTRVFGIVHDRTELLERQEQLERSQRLEAIGQLAGGIAHDFNNLMAVIHGNLELLEDNERSGSPLLPHERREAIVNALAAVRSGAGLTENILKSTSKARLELQRVCVNDIVSDLEAWLNRIIPASINVTMNLAAAHCFSILDPSGLQEAIVNVVVNARDAMPAGGKLAIETRNIRVDASEAFTSTTGNRIEGDFVEVKIQDSGYGIDQDLLGRVFEPFVSTKEHSIGTGLGLSMVHGFVRQTGGDVQIESQLGKGTSVRLVFPLDLKVETSPHHTETQQTDSATGSERTRVLVAEDQPEVLALLIRTLTTAGFQVEAATSGDQAFLIFQEDPLFDLLVTDVIMPGDLSGPALAKALRKQQPSLPVVFLTGYSSDTVLTDDETSMNEICLLKPVSKAELLAAIRTVMQEN